MVWGMTWWMWPHSPNSWRSRGLACVRCSPCVRCGRHPTARQKNDGEAVHLAAKWAGKEAFLKAWCDYLGDAPYPFTLDNFPWPEIEILDDSRGVPHVSLGKGTASVFQTDYANSAAGARYSSAYSPASDNGPYAVMQERRNARSAQRSTIGAGSMPHIHISLSHDGPIASAVVTISVE